MVQWLPFAGHTQDLAFVCIEFHEPLLACFPSFQVRVDPSTESLCHFATPRLGIVGCLLQTDEL